MSLNNDNPEIKLWKRKMRTKFKLNYKHYRHESSRCCTECLTKFLNVKERKYHNPYPIAQGLADNQKQNPLISLVQRKEKFQYKIASIKSHFQVYQRKLKVFSQFRSYYRMQDVLMKDPDKYFCSNYNWYYTGGNLVIKRIGNSDLLFHVNGNSELCAAKIKKKDTGWYIRKKPILSNHISDIFQLDSVSNNNKTFVAVRQKNDILLYDIKLNDTEDIVCELANIQNTDIPFVAMSLNRDNLDDYAAVNGNHKLQIWDLFKLKPVVDYEVPHSIEALEGDFFAQVTYQDNMLALINRTNFHIFDKRCENISVKLNCSHSEILEHQDRFVNIYCHKNNSNFYYLSTFREILLFDLRYTNIVSKYSHAFKNAPFISDHLYDETRNIFCISSCNKDEKLMIEQNGDQFYLPVLLPTVTNSFESNLLSSSNMFQSCRLGQRLKASTTGMKLWSNDNDSFAVFSSNYLGDIFCHEVTKNTESTSNLSNKWKKLFEQEEPLSPLEFVDKVVLNDINFNLDSPPPDLSSLLKNKRLKNSIMDLKNKKKGFSAKICDLWEQMNAQVLDELEDVPTDITVRNWLDHYCPPKEENETSICNTGVDINGC